MTIVTQIMQVCIIPILAILTKYIVDYINAKRAEIKCKVDNETAQKYTDMIADTVTKCVIATNQTYVSTLKNLDKFDRESQMAAFEKTYTAVLAILSEDAIKYIEETSSDIKAYLTAQIEAAVNLNKGSN